MAEWQAWGQEWPFPVSSACLKDKPRQVMYDLGMLHVARLTLEAWLFTSVQNNRKKKPTTPAQTSFPAKNHAFLTRCHAGGWLL